MQKIPSLAVTILTCGFAVSPALAETNETSPSPSVASVAALLDNPEMKEFMQSTMSNHVRSQFSELANRWELPAVEKEQFFSLLTAQRTSAVSPGGRFWQGESIDMEAMRKMTEESIAKRKELDQQVEALIGGERFQELKAFERSSAERTRLSLMEPLLAAVGPMNPAQREGLIKIMTEEREKPAAQPLGDSSQALNLDDLVSGKRTDELDGRIIMRAPEVLTPDQVNALRDGLARQRETTRSAMKLGASLLKQLGTR